MLERDIIKAAREWAKATYGDHARFFKHYGSPFAEAGVSDLIGCVEGLYVAAEAKRPGEKPTATQKAFLDAVRRAGGIAFVFTSLDDFKDQMRRLLRPPEHGM